MLPWRHHSGVERCYHGDSIMEERGGREGWKQHSGEEVETVQWGREALPWRQYSEGKGCYHGDSTVGKRGVTMETVVTECGVTIETVL